MKPATKEYETKLPIVSSALPPNKLLFTLKETAQLLSISERTVYRLIDRGLLKAHPSFRRQLIFRESLEAFCEERWMKPSCGSRQSQRHRRSFRAHPGIRVSAQAPRTGSLAHRFSSVLKGRVSYFL